MANTDPPSPVDELEAVAATEAKNSFGAVLDRVMVEGSVAITKHDEVKAVLLSRTKYEALMASQRDPIAELAAEFDDLVQLMKTKNARKAGSALFKSSPAKLGRAAVASRKRRGR